ncbi:MAG: helix-turn-helix transcriptional regulator [Gloeobacteraceae cyanobacterium ES-bin-144]|nr:helix-turn-helix transcriptional regulator [Verrucomicrobiales bacterium]
MSTVQNATSYVSHDVETSRLFFLDPVEDKNFAVVFGGFERCATDYRIDRGDFPWYSLEFVSYGSGTVCLGNQEHELVPGSFYVYGPSIPQRIETSPENPLGKYFVGFTGKDVEEFLQCYDIQPGYISRCLKGEPIRRAFDLLIERGVRKSRLARPLCAIITRQLLIMCRDDAADPVSTDTPAYATYSRGKDFIERNFLSVTSLDGIAKACKVDAPYLCRLFSRFHNESPYQYLTRLRMEHAARILLEGDASVRSVASALGFKDAFHFSRVFKSVHHVPPSRFRQSMHPQWPA